jgi:hypothetical protein
MLRVPNTGPAERERQALMKRLESKLEYFRGIPPARRDAECADEGERDCMAMLAELRASRASVR